MIIKRCGNCEHASQGGLSKHYRQWLVQCKVAGEELIRAESVFKAAKKLPKVITGPSICLTDFNDTRPCPHWKKRTTSDIGVLRQ